MEEIREKKFEARKNTVGKQQTSQHWTLEDYGREEAWDLLGGGDDLSDQMATPETGAGQDGEREREESLPGHLQSPGEGTWHPCPKLFSEH